MNERLHEYRAIAERLWKLRPILIKLNRAEWLETYDELLNENEPGSALDILCDAVIEAVNISPGEEAFREVAGLHEQMKMDPARLIELRKRSAFQS